MNNVVNFNDRHLKFSLFKLLFFFVFHFFNLIKTFFTSFPECKRNEYCTIWQLFERSIIINISGKRNSKIPWNIKNFLLKNSSWSSIISTISKLTIYILIYELFWYISAINHFSLFDPQVWAMSASYQIYHFQFDFFVRYWQKYILS